MHPFGQRRSQLRRPLPQVATAQARGRDEDEENRVGRIDDGDGQRVPARRHAHDVNRGRRGVVAVRRDGLHPTEDLRR